MNDYESRIWRRLAEIAEQSLTKVGMEPNHRFEFDGLKFVQLIGQEAEKHGALVKPKDGWMP